MNQITAPYNLYGVSENTQYQSCTEDYKSYDNYDNGFLNYIWEQFLVLFEKEKDKKTINNWLRSLEIMSWNNQKKIIEIYTPNKFIKNWIEDHFLSLIEKIFCRLLQEKIVHIHFIIKLKDSKCTEENNAKIDLTLVSKKKLSEFHFTPSKAIKHDSPRYVSEFDKYINAAYSTEHFLITQGNQNVVLAIQYFLEKDDLWHSTLFIHGSKGIGKTHLLQSIRSLFLQKNIAVAYIHAEVFLKYYISSAKSKTIGNFESNLVGADILLIDDIDFLIRKNYTQEFLIKIIDIFNTEQKKIIFTSKLLPQNIVGFVPALVLKLEQSLTFQFESVSKEDLCSILQLKIQNYNYNFPIELVHHICNIPHIGVSQAESIMHKIMAESIITKKTIDVNSVMNSLNVIIDQNKKKISEDYSIDSIVKEISNINQISMQEIFYNKSKKNIKIKYLIIYVLRVIRRFSCVEISKYFKYKDHTTISYACKIFEKLYQNDDDIKKILSLFK